MDKAEVPPGVVTVTLTAPSEPGGAVTTSSYAESKLIVAELVPKSTAVAPKRFVPMIVTDVPPCGIPETGLMLVIVGGAA